MVIKLPLFVHNVRILGIFSSFQPDSLYCGGDFGPLLLSEAKLNDTRILTMVNKEGLIIIPPCADTLEEDIVPQQVNPDLECEVLYRDDDYTVYKPLSDSGLILLANGTKWLGERGYVDNRYTRGDVDDISDDNWHLKNWDRCIVLVNNHTMNSSKPKKWLYYVGYGQGEVPSGADYPMANIVYDTQDKDLWRWFISQNYPYVSTNLKKKVGGQLLDKSRKELVYPDDFVGDYDPKNMTYEAKAASGRHHQG